ncbi:Crp/Fnr family transcriptional regulator [Listeria weihenstephanensis]|uniref:Crp/Fnr family transcriptional regulator n=1 Tax=Listeria weihenstephanensis TaxID=1006155 RepID=A0A841Z9X8_9LIST|nr:Crp/Fnr family transcriptional regulator [Listeria weihenstephanensis]MBC1501978.1 Crp/Fnr family transcriptional regulator [Listeria weihenstephanensis]
MYDRDEIKSLASFSNILRLLKKDPEFSRYCTQHRVPKGNVLTIAEDKQFCYLVESGYLQYSYVGEFATGYFFFIKPGRFASLPFLKDQLPAMAKLLAVTDVVWWKIDFEFLRKMLLLEDPKNFVILNHALEAAFNFYMMTKKYLSTSEERIYFCLVRLVDVGINIRENQVELPLFLTYDRLAYLSNASKGYTANILTKLREDNILDASKKPWIITDVARLKAKLNIMDMPNF